jgi:exportin-2 (importin alpha re-exporter)
MTEIDYEEQTAGYQAAYSRLAASESAAVDPVAYVGDVQAYLGQELVRASRADGRIKELLQAGSPEVVSQFVQSLAMAGYVL